MAMKYLLCNDCHRAWSGVLEPCDRDDGEP